MSYLLGRSTPIPVRVQGVFRQIDPEARYWYREASALFRGVLLTSPEQYQALVVP